MSRFVQQATAGSVDGLGLAVGLLLVLGGHALLLAAVANASAEWAGMAAGQWLSLRGRPMRTSGALANGTAAAVGALLPVLAYLAFGVPGAVVALLGSAVLIAAVTPSQPAWRSWVETFSIIAVVTCVVWVSSLVTG